MAAWVSPKVYAILCKSEEGKDIIERLPDMTQDECQMELDRFFGDSNQEYNQAKIDDEAEASREREIGNEEIKEEEYDEPLDEEALDIAFKDFYEMEESTRGERYNEIIHRLEDVDNYDKNHLKPKDIVNAKNNLKEVTGSSELTEKNTASCTCSRRWRSC